MNNLFQSICDFNPMGMLVFNNESRLAYANYSGIKLFGFSEEEFFKSDLNALFFKIEKEKVLPYRFSFNDTGTGELEAEEIDLYGKRKCGDMFPVKVSYIYICIEAKNFIIVYIKEHQSHFWQSNLFLSKIFQESVNEIYIIDASSLRILNANKEAVHKTGFALEEIIHFSPWDLLLGHDEKIFIKHIDSLLTGRLKKVTFESEILRKDSETYPVEIQLQLLNVGNDKILMETVVDLSAKRQEEREHLKRLIQAQDDERERIAKELHDDLGQCLTAIQLNINVLEKHFTSQSEMDPKSIFNKLNTIVKNTIAGLKTISRDLMPNVLMDFGLVKGLQYLCDNFNSPQLNVRLQVFNLNQALDPPVELAIYRITQELLNNAVKHGHAKEINVQVIQNDKNVVLTVEDDGVGFTISKSKKSIGGLGLKNIQSRIIALGGNFSFDSIVGYGSSVLVEIPLNQKI